LKIRFLAAACFLIGWAASADAAEIVTARVEQTGDRYRVDFVVLIDGRAERLRRIVTDYTRLHELSPAVVSSRLLSGRGGGDARIEVVLRPCVLIVFCKTITKVSDSYVEADASRVRYVSVPGLSDFREGRETISMIQVSADGGPRVRFRYNAVLIPGFYVPPLVGPWLIRRAIIKDLETTSRRVERLLRETRP